MRVSVACVSRSAASSSTMSSPGRPICRGSAGTGAVEARSRRTGDDLTRSMRSLREMTVAVVGLGDLGRLIVEDLARLGFGRVAALGRDAERARAVAAQAEVVARLAGGATRVEAVQAD